MVVCLVFPIIDYAMAAYWDVNNGLTHQLLKAHNAYIRCFCNLKYDDHVTAYLQLPKWFEIR